MSETTQENPRVAESTPSVGAGNAPRTDTPPPSPAASAPARAASVDVARKGPKKRHIALVVFLILGVIAAVAGVLYWMHARQFEETDDAMVDGAITPISARVAGIVSSVLVRDNEVIKAGDVLLEIDPRDYRTQANEAQANLAAAKARLQAAQTNVDMVGANSNSTLAQADASVQEQQAAVQQEEAGVASAEAQVASAQADVAAAQAEGTRRQADLKRYDALDPRAVSQQTRDAARAAAESAEAQLTAAQKRAAAAQALVSAAHSRVAAAQSKVAFAEAGVEAAKTAPQQVATAKSQVQVAQASVDQAQAALDAALLNLSYTTIKAPIGGKVTRKLVQPGQYVEVGQTLLAIVPDDLWITGNFKETQLTRMHPGQPVEIRVDRYPSMRFTGHVDSIQAGTGGRFSLLPPENATGNFVKVVQRVPVKIRFNGPFSELPPMGPGMSAVPTVRVLGEDGKELIPATAPASREP